MNEQVVKQPQHDLVARYFEMWNTGEAAVAPEILTPTWLDHAHPEATGPDGVRKAVEAVRAAQPDLRFHVTAILGDGDLVSVVGCVGRGPEAGGPLSKLIWLIRLEGDRMAEMWTYRESS